MPTATPLDRIGLGIDTARYGHRVSFANQPPSHSRSWKTGTGMRLCGGRRVLGDVFEALTRRAKGSSRATGWSC
jgi:hypothetical protein